MLINLYSFYQKKLLFNFNIFAAEQEKNDDTRKN